MSSQWWGILKQNHIYMSYGLSDLANKILPTPAYTDMKFL